MKNLPREFYERNPASVAKDLLGKLLVRRLGSKLLVGKIVETEAYFGKKDPASRAYSGRPKYVVELMRSDPGRTLIYMVHNNWLLNVSSHPNGKFGAVLIRAVEPLEGIDEMEKNRKVRKVFDLTNGPGKLTKSFGIGKELNGISVTGSGELIIAEGLEDIFEVSSSRRIGVSRDLEKNLRYFISGNKFVSGK